MKSICKCAIYVLLIFIIVFIVGYNLKDIKSEKKIHIIRKELVNEIPTKEDLPTIDFVSIRKKYNNNDIIGAIRITNSNFEEIIFQSKNNKYYLNHRYNKKSGSGEIFIDYRNKIDTSKIKFIYISGSKKRNILLNYFESNNCNSNIEIETEKKIYKYELVNIYNNKLDYNNINYDEINNNATCGKINLDDEILVINSVKDKITRNIIMRRVKA